MPMPDQRKESPLQTPPLGCLVRLVWMLFGNAILLLCAYSIMGRGRVFSWVDGVYWGMIVALVALRHFDITRLGGQTASGEPASLQHWRRYAVLLAAFSLGLWFIAHAIAWFR